MQGSSLLTVKQVATALGIDERSVREKLALNTLKGVKKPVGNKEQWFVHQRELDAELARRGMSQINQTFAQPELPPAQTMTQPPHQVYQTMTMEPELEQVTVDATVLENSAEASIFDSEGAEVADSTSGGEHRSWLGEQLGKQNAATAEWLMKPLLDRVEQLSKENVQKDLLIEEQKLQLRLLPDFQARAAREKEAAAAAELKVHEALARQKTLDLLAAEKAKELKAKEAELVQMQQEIEAERKVSEAQSAKVAEKEAEAKALEAENEELKQKYEEAVLNATKLAELEKVVFELQKPKPSWFKRLFTAGE